MSAETDAETDTAAADRFEFVIEDPRWDGVDGLDRLCRAAVEAAARRLPCPRPGVCAVLLADDAVLHDLNLRFRGKDKPTNVLSFPAPESEGYPGDIALAYETCAAEAEAAGKPLRHHAAHLVVHGFLHLNGHDHMEETEAAAMEAIETSALAEAGVPDPYATP